MPWLEYVRNNFLLKVFSLALAILIWLAIQSHLQSDLDFPLNPFRTIETQEFTLRVKLLITPGQGQSYKITPPEVKVIVSGDAMALRKLNESKIQVYARIDEAKGPMMSDFPLETKLPRDVTLEEIKPDRVSVESFSQGGGFMLFPFGPAN